LVTRRGHSTLLLGYDPDDDLYAAWDFKLRRHLRKPDGQPVKSPSAQTRGAVLDEAALEGIAFHTHDIDARQSDGSKLPKVELVACFRPEYFGAYLMGLEPKLRPSGTTPAATAAKRRHEATQRLVRDRLFADEVLKAYRQRCCFCGLSAGIVEAAHIRAVKDGGPDEIRNGVALCPTHHKLFDKGYILIRPRSLTLETNDKSMRSEGLSEEDRGWVASSVLASPLWPATAGNRPLKAYIDAHRSAFA
jgi:putative restriction endonuclease